MASRFCQHLPVLPLQGLASDPAPFQNSPAQGLSFLSPAALPCIIQPFLFPSLYPYLLPSWPLDLWLFPFSSPHMAWLRVMSILNSADASACGCAHPYSTVNLLTRPRSSHGLCSFFSFFHDLQIDRFFDLLYS